MKNIIKGVVFSLIALFCCGAVAHGLMPHTVVKTIEVSISPNKIWPILSRFEEPIWYPDFLSASLDGELRPGVRRLIRLKSGGMISEELESISKHDMEISYAMIGSTGIPVSGLRGTLSIESDKTGGSIVKWKGIFYRADRTNNTPPQFNDEAASNAVANFFEIGLNRLKTIVETGK